MTRDDLKSLPPEIILALCIWAEARGEGERGMQAVAWVIRNRVEADLGNDGKPDWWGEGYAGVILAPWQFSSFNANDPNLPKLIALAHGGDAPGWNLAKKIARDVIAGRTPDLTKGSTHYFNARVCGFPAWSKNMLLVAVVGNHRFYRDWKGKREEAVA